MSGKGRCITAVVVVFALFTPATYAQNGGFVQDHNLSKGDFGYITWTEYSQNHLPSPDCCFSLALDANFLWVGTSAGAVRWNLQKDTYQLFRAEDDWSMEYIQQLGMNNVATDWRSEEARQYLVKWLTNAVENIIVLSPGHVWVDTFKGAMIIHGDRKVVYASVEDALVALYHTELRPTLAKVVAMDKKGYLWLLKKKEKSTLGFLELFCYDGTAWKKDKLVGIVKAEFGVKDVLEDGIGNLWACNAGGIYRHEENRWEHVLKKGRYGYHEMRLGTGGTLCAFGLSTLARFTVDRWEVFEGEGRYKDLSLPPPFMGQQAVVLETPDNELWFAASFGRASTIGFMRFDGKQFSQASFYPVAATISPSGQAFAASGERLFRYDKGEWNQLGRPKFGMFRAPFFSGAAEGKMIEDILAVTDDTVYAATYREGLLRYHSGSWDKMSFDKSKQEVESIDQDAADMIAEMEEGIQSLLMGLSTLPTVDTFYSKYVEGDRKNLIKANDEQLAEDIVNGENYTSPISYYRLLTRNNKLAKVSLQKRMEAMCASDYGEGWLNKLEIASYGPPVTECLLKIAKTGTPEQRAVAIDTLGVMKDPEAVRKLLDSLGDAKKLDRLSYLCLARAAIMNGNPRGMDLLIEAATARGDLQQICQDELDGVTRGYDDLPGDWSREKWNAWWKKHRSSWNAKTAYPTAMPTAMITSTYKMYEAVAEKIEKEN